MTKAGWRKKIKAACEEAGTWRECFSQVVDTLADILARRDETQKIYEDSGGNPVVTYTNKGGSTNIVQHPALKLVNELNRDALAYWRDLGLTPAGLRKINEDALRPRKSSKLADALRDLTPRNE